MNILNLFKFKEKKEAVKPSLLVKAQTPFEIFCQEPILATVIDGRVYVKEMHYDGGWNIAANIMFGHYCDSRIASYDFEPNMPESFAILKGMKKVEGYYIDLSTAQIDEHARRAN